MATQNLAVIAPLDTPRPALPVGEFLTDAQWTTLMAIGDAVIPSIVASSVHSTTALAIETSKYASATSTLVQGQSSTAQADVPRQYLEENASSIPNIKEALQRFLGEYIDENARKGIRVVLSALESDSRHWSSNKT